MFLPGLTADHHLFDKQIEGRGDKYNCLTWDAPAHGSSRPFELKFTMYDIAQYLHDILEKEQNKTVIHLFGWQMQDTIPIRMCLKELIKSWMILLAT